MKKLFIQPKIKVSVFSTENLITASGGEPATTNYSVMEGKMQNEYGSDLRGVATASFNIGSQE